MTTITVQDLIDDRRAVAGHPANSEGLPRELREEIEAAAAAGATYEELRDRFQDDIDDLIAAGY